MGTAGGLRTSEPLLGSPVTERIAALKELAMTGENMDTLKPDIYPSTFYLTFRGGLVDTFLDFFQKIFTLYLLREVRRRFDHFFLKKFFPLLTT